MVQKSRGFFKFLGMAKEHRITPGEDKMYDLGLLSEAKKQMQGQGLAPAARKSLKK